ncbi:hypothetical protein KC19_7G043200 [Ceratodon purpureus]|uniref:Histone-lysine N-methyltransferase n=1 Tax=Ceratodon purpureus TaxID=3225 RepID=A0A8T0H5X3_CERPU|nr:hypothetical protein KC19_7G043200 [Ceratodon purpureus]
MATQPPSMFPKRHPVFSEDSSDTEYTSSESEESVSQKDDNCVESQLANEPLSESRAVELAVNESSPSMMPRIVNLEHVFIDLDSVEEMDPSSGDVEILGVQASKTNLVVDISDYIGTRPGVRQLEAKKELVTRSQILRPCSPLSPEVPRVPLGQPEEGVLPAAKESEDLARVSMAQPENCVVSKAAVESEDGARIKNADLDDLVIPTAAEESEDGARIKNAGLDDLVVPTAADEGKDEASTISGNYKYRTLGEVFPPDWSSGVLCDMCERGPSLPFGAWYSWCCGKPSRGCVCPYEDQLQKRMVLTGKRDKNPEANINLAHVWSGKVHRLCALWSAEVYQNSDEPWIMMELETAMRRSRKMKCSDCGRLGATLGCRVKKCKRTYHYPCADGLSAYRKIRLWEGFVKPVACKDHRLGKAKQKKRKRGKLAEGAGTPRSGEKALVGVHANEIGSGDEERTRTVTDTPISESGACVSFPQPLGKKLLTPDISYGCEESVPVPCTNDVDDESPPYVEYLTKSRFQNHPLGSKDCPQPPRERLAKACRGCTQHDLDDPSAPLSVHVPFKRREDDDREDWLEERMYGRLPYDKYGRLVIGTRFNELVECNERCGCGEFCVNREMQKGLTTPVEVYKTENKGWALRTLVGIPRGKFVIEYIGEMMTQEQAQRYGEDSYYVETKRSYIQELDYPESKRTPDFLLDSYHASNVSRFINHSCNPNLKLYRVYVETTYKWLPHIGFYAIRDIEAGEELVHDYNFGRTDESTDEEKASTHVKCVCGEVNCHKWLQVG